MHDQHAGLLADERDRHEILDRVVRQLRYSDALIALVCDASSSV